MSVLKIKGMSGRAAIEYYTRAEGCGVGTPGQGHEHAAGQAPETAPGQQMAYYLRDGIGHEAPSGTWFGSGLEDLGLTEGQAVEEEDAKTVFEDLMNPLKKSELLAQAEAQIIEKGLKEDGRAANKLRAEAVEGARLGNRLPTYKDTNTRVEEKLSREPLATEARQAEIKREVQTTDRKAVAFFDLTFAAPKSASVYYAGLLAAGRTDDARNFLAAHEAGVKAAMGYLEDVAGYSRAGHHTSSPDGVRPTTGRYTKTRGWIAAAFTHRTSRELDPHLHTHVLLDNRMKTIDADGTERWRSWDSTSGKNARRGADAMYRRTFEQESMKVSPVIWDTRPDGKAREIRGIDENVRGLYSAGGAKTTAAYQEWVKDYAERHGHEPGALVRAAAMEVARLETRKPKQARMSDEEFRKNVEAKAYDSLGASLSAVAERADVEGMMAEAAGEKLMPEQVDRERVIKAAVGDVQGRRSTWNRADLMESVEKCLPSLAQGTTQEQVKGLVAGLAEEAVTKGVMTGQDRLVQVSGLELVAMPEVLTHESGRSVYRPGGGMDERWATVGSLAVEDRIKTAAKDARPELVAPRHQVEQMIRGGRLSGDQAEAARNVLTSGRKLDVISAPAGSGKTYTMGTIRAAWEEGVGGRVLGVAPSQRAARVLGNAGITDVMNLTRFERVQDGEGRSSDIEPASIQPGDLVIIDEASMASRDQVASVVDAVEIAGGKTLMVGDPRQMDSVEQGGVMKMLVDDPKIPTSELSTVRRFRDLDANGQVKLREWEAKASLQLAEGDLTGLGAYEKQGRLYGGTIEDLEGRIAGLYVADRLEGRTSMAIASTNARCAEINGVIRDRLVAAGVVEPQGVALRDGTVAGDGDYVEARENAHGIKDDLGEAVDNHDLFHVVERYDDGSLKVERIKDEGDTRGERLTLPSDYVRDQVTLGYAATVHAAEGRTVDRGYPLADGSVSRRALYVMATRGSELNLMFVETERARDAHDPEGLEADGPLAVLGALVERDEAEMTANQWLETEFEHMQSLRVLGPKWEDMVTQDAGERFGEMIKNTIGEENFARIDDPSSIYRRLRVAELEGHDAGAVIRGSLGYKQGHHGVGDAEHMAKLVYWRIDEHLKDQVGEPIPASYVDRTPPTLLADPEKGRPARELAEYMDMRRLDLGERAVEAQPAYLTNPRALGPVPEDATARLEWTMKAGEVEAYRERYGIRSQTSALGPEPGRGMAEQIADRRLAQDALGLDPISKQVMDASPSQLQDWVESYGRELSWKPAYVADDLRDMRQTRLDMQTQAELHAKNPEAAELFRSMEADAAAQVGKLELVDSAYDAWAQETEPTRELAAAAQAELDNRGLDGVEVTAEQGSGLSPEVAARQAEALWVRAGTEQDPDAREALQAMAAQLDDEVAQYAAAYGPQLEPEQQEGQELDGAELDEAELADVEVDEGWMLLDEYDVEAGEFVDEAEPETEQAGPEAEEEKPSIEVETARAEAALAEIETRTTRRSLSHVGDEDEELSPDRPGWLHEVAEDLTLGDEGQGFELQSDGPEFQMTGE